MEQNCPRSFVFSLTLLVILWTVISPTPTTAPEGDAWQTFTAVSIVNALAVDNDFIWTATDGGVLRWDRTNDTFVKYTTADGLPHNTVWDVAIDPTGRKWFATASGVSVFDGQSWITYTTADGLPNDDVRAIAVGADGHVWLGAWGGGVSEFDGQSWTTYTTQDGLAANYILAMAIDAVGRKWFATATCRDGGCAGNGVSVFDGQSWTTYTTQDGLASDWVEAIAPHPTGQTIWFGTLDGLSKFDGQNWNTTLTSTTVNALAIDGWGNLWVAHIGEEGVSMFNGQEWRSYPIADGPPNLGSSIAIDDQGQVWVGTGSIYNGGESDGSISGFDGQNWRTLTPTGLIGNDINAVTIDQNGSVWLGTRAGLNQFNGQNLQNEPRPAPSNGQAKAWHTYLRADGLPSNLINTLVIDKAGQIWVGGNDVGVFDGDAWRSYTSADGLLAGEVQAMAIDGTGRKWVALAGQSGQSGGVSMFDDAAWTNYTREDGLASNYVLSVAIDDMDRKWFGTSAGISLFDGQAWTTYTSADGLAHNWVNAIAIAPDEHYWFGTQGGGVSVFNGNTWTTYTMADGLASNVVYTLTIDTTDRIWAGTSGGVSVFANGTWTTYTNRDGLADNQVKAIASDAAGQLWFGTEAGLSRFDEGRWSARKPSVLSVKVGPAQAPPASIEFVGPRFIDAETEQIYTRGFVDGVEKTLILALADERLLGTIDLIGDLALDRANDWLYIDQGSAGLAVINTGTGRLHTIIFLPNNEPNGTAAPQADPVSGRVFAVRDNVAYIADPVSGEVIDTLTTDHTQIVNCASGPSPSIPPIRWVAIDDTARILYLASNTSICIQTAGGGFPASITSYDLDSGGKIAEGSSQLFPQVVAEGYLYDTATYNNAAWFEGVRSVWRDGQPWFSSDGWSDGGGRVDFDPARRRFYEVTASNLRVFEAETMAMILHLPRPITGAFERFDPETDQLQFRLEGQLHGWPADNIQPPDPEPLVMAKVPAVPVRALAVAPNESQGLTLFGVWDDPYQPLGLSSSECYNGNIAPHLKMFISQDGGQTWGQPTAGLRSDCNYMSSLAMSPGYADDRTLLLGLVGRGIFKSTDGGQLWLPASAGLTNMRISQILIAPGFNTNKTAFAWTAELSKGAIYRSTDGGDTWQVFYTSSPVLALSPEFSQDHTMASTQVNTSTNRVELHLSRDGGDQWQVAGQLPEGVSVQELSLAPLFAQWQTLFALAKQDDQPVLYRSSDSGRNWTAVLTPTADLQQLVYALDIEAERPLFLLAGETVYRSVDGGLTWQVFDLPANVVPTALAISPNYAEDGLIFLGTADGRVVQLKGS